MSRVLAVVIGSAALLAAAPALAGPCEQLAGGRWLFHVEGGSPAQVVTGVLDFRDGAPNQSAQRGLVFYASTSDPFPAYVAGVPLAFGSSGWGRWIACTAQPGNIARLSRAITVDLAVSADGRTAVATGFYGGAAGWATREPASPARPTGAVAQRPRN
ncbi:MAG: hypothetical protein PSV23_08965 [Brevundimonas sp.]|uniref:hypothetical protein n=1 Tax=Brevundimonas sp. TaxID=1871086 RepID=UPI0024893887|nr:hypothetical protein [Brevundimonas sp.]MDI1326912.1 hypothetical protein [Brevundimonas sp.]